MKPPRLPNAEGLWHCCRCDRWLRRSFFTPLDLTMQPGSYCRPCAAKINAANASLTRAHKTPVRAIPPDAYIRAMERMHEHAESTGDSFVRCMIEAVGQYIERAQSKVQSP